MKKKTIIIVLVIAFFAVSIFFVFFQTKTAKNLKIGNNSTSQEIIDYILNISSYEATVEVEVISNKNQNKYSLRQKYKNPDLSEQEVLEPSNIAGIKISKNGNQLKIENSQLALSSIYENYECITDNSLDLQCFIEEYKISKNANWKEENDQIVMTLKKDSTEKKLWIDKKNCKPTKLEVKSANKKNEIYILYNEVNLNSLK